MTNVKTSFFDEAALSWDLREKPEVAALAGAFVARTGLKAGMTALDVGAGTGILTPFIRGCGAAALCVDSSAGMLRVLSSKFPWAEVVCADFEAHDFSPRLFDAVLIWNTFPHFENPAEAIKKAYAALKNGGRLFIAHSMTRQQLDDMHRRAGRQVEDDSLPSDAQFRACLAAAGFADALIEETPAFYLEALKPRG